MRANSLSKESTGAYTLEIVEVRPTSDLVPEQLARGELSTADTKLSDGSFYDCYPVQTSSGMSYRVIMRSTDFDTYMSAGSGQCAGTASVSDDDSAGGTNSSVAFFGDGQIWFVRANSLEANATGTYTVELNEGSQAKR